MTRITMFFLAASACILLLLIFVSSKAAPADMEQDNLHSAWYNGNQYDGTEQN